MLCKILKNRDNGLRLTSIRLSDLRRHPHGGTRDDYPYGNIFATYNRIVRSRSSQVT